MPPKDDAEAEDEETLLNELDLVDAQRYARWASLFRGACSRCCSESIAFAPYRLGGCRTRQLPHTSAIPFAAALLQNHRNFRECAGKALGS